ncbi:Inositol oxygenase [Thalictrum thalictroides]|uniref:Inositol oxygenase n=1 Tax=Thalictrum thalictroides TaxID=46969 RepID=A0A7J6WP99_THATH|nr:Inositol oxygenase [Thalictrum thalictroides]
MATNNVNDKPQLGTEVKAKNISDDTKEGFEVPTNNAFGQTFRDYHAHSERKETVEEFYRINHINQSVDFVNQMREKYGKLNRTEMSIWECCELLNEFIDESDPDLDEPQIEHLLQTAEAIRKDYPNEDWMHMVGLIHGTLIRIKCNLSWYKQFEYRVLIGNFKLAHHLFENPYIHGAIKIFFGVSDLGKVLLHPKFGELPQWAVVGDTYPVGCAFC